MATTAKKNLLAIVDEILIAVNGDGVNSIGDTDEAYDIAQIVQSVYFDMVSSRKIPEIKEVIQLDAIGDSTRPTYFQIPDNVKYVERLEYDVSTTSGTTSFRELHWVEPLDFLDKMQYKDTSDTTRQTMLSINSSAKFIIRNNVMPTCFTSFDDKYIVCDAFDSTEENTLQTSKNRAYVVKIPQFSLTDTFIPEMDEPAFRAMVNEAKSTAVAIINRTVNPKIEQHARKTRMLTQNDRYRVGRSSDFKGFGRT